MRVHLGTGGEKRTHSFRKFIIDVSYFKARNYEYYNVIRADVPRISLNLLSALPLEYVAQIHFRKVICSEHIEHMSGLRLIHVWLNSMCATL